MKKLLFGLISLLMSFTVISQEAVSGISGKVIDEKGKPLESVTIYLRKSIDSSLVKVAISDKQGFYQFLKVPFDEYIFEATSVNHKTVLVPAFNYAALQPLKTVETFTMIPVPKNMEAVVVTGKKPLIEQKIDRVVLNVDAAITNMGATALEILEKTPGVSVDKDGKISVKGKPDVIVMIDGKPSYLSPAELSSMLATMNANQMSQIEIMTNPSAKYDASGNAGIINIKTKKNTTQGFNGSVTLSYGQGVYPKTNNSINLNYRNTKFNTFLNYGYSVNQGFMDFDIQRNFIDANGQIISTLNQLSSRKNQSLNNNLKWGLDYFMNSKTTLGIAISGFVAPQHQDAFTESQILNEQGKIISTEETIKEVDNTWKNGAVNLSWRTLLDASGKEINVNADYLHYDFSGNQELTGLSFDPSHTLISQNRLKNTLPLSIDIYSGRLDYVHPLKNGAKLEAGLKSSLVKTNNISIFYNYENSSWVLDEKRSNRFKYDENINAAYVNLNKTFGKFYLQAGLRLENTHYNGLQSEYTIKQDSSFSRNYTNIFPTALVSYTINPDNRLSVSIGRRIDRPAYQNLNPFVSFIDKYTYSTGNPYLQPQYSNTIELSHTFKNLLTATLNYSVIHDMINETLSHIDSVIVRSVGNIGTRQNAGISVSANIQVSKWYSANLFTNLYENWYNGEINGELFKASQLTLSFNFNNQFSFPHGWNAELSGNYTSQSRDEGQAIVMPLGQVSAGISRQLLKNKATLKMSIRDIFYTQNPKEIQNFQDVRSTLRISRDTRVFTIAFVYRFGTSAKSKPTVPKITEEQQRVKIN